MHDAAVVSTDENDAPPRAPDAGPRFQLTLAQRLAIPLMLFIPLLTLGGAFGERTAELGGAAGPLLVQVSAPTRLRYRQRMPLRLLARNAGAAPVDDVRIRIDSTYLDAFSAVVLSPDRGPDGWVHAGTLRPGESASIGASVEGDRAGRIRGNAVVTDARGDTVRVPLSSLVFP